MPSGGRPFGSHTAATSFGIERRPLGPHDVLLAAAADATLVNVGAMDGLTGVTGNDLVKTRTSIAETQQVIDYCAARNIKADIDLARGR